MVKEETIILRVSGEDKGELKEIARRYGMDLTTYIMSAAMKQARRDRKKAEERTSGVDDYVPAEALRGRRLKQHVSRALPVVFRDTCATAKSGGANSYKEAARDLTLRLYSIGAWEDWDDQDWVAECHSLRDKDDDEIWEWFQYHLPNCMALVPKRRKEQFVNGVVEWLDENGHW